MQPIVNEVLQPPKPIGLQPKEVLPPPKPAGCVHAGASSSASSSSGLVETELMEYPLKKTQFLYRYILIYGVSRCGITMSAGSSTCSLWNYHVGW